MRRVRDNREIWIRKDSGTKMKICLDTKTALRRDQQVTFFLKDFKRYRDNVTVAALYNHSTEKAYSLLKPRRMGVPLFALGVLLLIPAWRFVSMLMLGIFDLYADPIISLIMAGSLAAVLPYTS